jgi:hypothetical protein
MMQDDDQYYASSSSSSSSSTSSQLSLTFDTTSPRPVQPLLLPESNSLMTCTRTSSFELASAFLQEGVLTSGGRSSWCSPEACGLKQSSGTDDDTEYDDDENGLLAFAKSSVRDYYGDYRSNGDQEGLSNPFTKFVQEHNFAVSTTQEQQPQREAPEAPQDSVFGKKFYHLW